MNPLETINFVIEEIKQIIQKPIVRVLIFITVFFFAFVYLHNRYLEFYSVLASIDINYWNLIIAFILLIIIVITGSIIWWSIIKWLGSNVNWIDIGKGYAISSLAKYVPGHIWKFTSRSIFSQGLSIPLNIILLGLVLEFILITAIGGLSICFSYLLFENFHQDQNSIIQFSVIIVSLFLLIFLGLIPKLITRLDLLQKHTYSINNSFYRITIILITISWIMLSFTFRQIYISLGNSNISFIESQFYISSAYLAGNIALPIPNGLIIREAVLVFLSRQQFNESLIILSSIILRVISLLSESLVTAFFYLYPILMCNSDKKRDEL